MPLRSIAKDIKAIGDGYVLIAGSFRPDTANPPTNVKGAGVSSVSRTGAGTFQVTFKDNFPQVIAAGATVQLNAAADLVAQIGAIDLAGASAAKTMVIRTLAAAVATDIAANANNVVNFWVLVKKVNSGS